MRSSSTRRAVFVQAVGQAVLLELVDDVAAAGEVADQHALAIADQFGLDVLVGGGVFQHGADVHAALVGEGALADEGLVVAQRQIGEFGDEAADAGQAGKLLGADGGVAELQFQVGDDAGKVGVAAALAVAVHAALHVGGAGLDRGQGIGRRRRSPVVVGVDADDAIEAAPHLADDLDQAAGQRAAVGIAQAEHVGAGVAGGFQRPQGVGRIGRVAVEEVLGVVDHFLAVILEDSARCRR